MKPFLRACLLFLLGSTLARGAESNAMYRIALAGDSTMCAYPPEHSCRGWGQYLGEHLKPGAEVLNLAVSGRSTRTFLPSAQWRDLLRAKPDLVLLQFGHNDSHAAGKPESTDAANDFRDNLRRMIREVRAVGAQPVLITPMHRRVFHVDGRPNDILRPYAEAMIVVAGELEVPLIDLHASSGRLLKELGQAESMRLHANLDTDKTHFSEAGARAMLTLVLQDLPSTVPEIKPWLKDSPTR